MSFLQELAEANNSRVKRWHGKEGVFAWANSQWGCAAAGEMGELCNVLKKIWRHDENVQSRAVTQTREELVKMAAMEIGDVVVYLDLLAQKLGVNLEDCIRDTFNRVSDREGFPERL